MWEKIGHQEIRGIIDTGSHILVIRKEITRRVQYEGDGHIEIVSAFGGKETDPLRMLQMSYQAVAPDAKSGLDTMERRRQMIQESKFLGEDAEHTNLVKGLVYALLQKKQRRQTRHNSINRFKQHSLQFVRHLSAVGNQNVVNDIGVFRHTLDLKNQLNRIELCGGVPFCKKGDLMKCLSGLWFLEWCCSVTMPHSIHQ
ncbi:hypothetical protein NPIL_320291 [Nephila pilipes]|uniref:RED-like N-terminal domain-containing protein n=1 Tax=Nephila pilipes TaxID=299642 RepID=A0A8X6PHU4_NEPPI|nr:hypothetical protein NPIL_365331 [Nephila pilipes]GFT65013.1 hypothetical protein NPIL_320291 [Nephila pilipes]